MPANHSQSQTFAEISMLKRFARSGSLWRSLVSTCGVVGCLAAADFSNATPENAPNQRETERFAVAISIQNPNDRAVRIGTIDSSCPCSTLSVRDRFLLPNARTVLDLAVDNSNRSGPQHLNISLYLTDPDLSPIEVAANWNVRACVQVDSLAPGMDATDRPKERAFQDVYKYVASARPDELHVLSKRIRLSCPAGEIPEGGLKVEGVDYAGKLWKFTPSAQSDGSVLIVAEAKNPDQEVAEKPYEETVTVRTNHRDKSKIELTFLASISRNAGREDFDPNAKR